jgi:hypothetical protein
MWQATRRRCSEESPKVKRLTQRVHKIEQQAAQHYGRYMRSLNDEELLALIEADYARREALGVPRAKLRAYQQRVDQYLCSLSNQELRQIVAGERDALAAWSRLWSALDEEQQSDA